ncbi:MAG: phospholipid carrier-dependent glycosyltransferase [Candidatus Woesearchaeota archaeon]
MSEEKVAVKGDKIRKIVFILILMIISFFVFVYNYWTPSALFWDENYFLPAAEKYIKKVFFMEPHPPLGKMFIAAGEIIINPNKNINKDYFLTTDYIRKIPNNYSFAGIRFFPVVFAFFCPILFFAILYKISKDDLSAFLFTLIFTFNNALVVHFRGAMLDSIQLFFILSTVLYFCNVVEKPKIRTNEYIILGLLSGLAISVKLNSAILVLLFPALYIKEKLPKNKTQKLSIKNFYDLPLKALFFIIGVAIIFFLVWQIHFLLARNVIEERYYGASDTYKKLLTNKTKNIEIFSNFFVMLRDNLQYIHNYEAGVPKLDLCKPDENGSPPLSWVIGGRSINYRWETDGRTTRYLYLQANPAIWLIGLTGILISFSLCTSVILFSLKIRNDKLFYYILIFLTLYVGYMVATMMIRRVLYLYHYFIPLTFSLILSFLAVEYIFLEKNWNKKVKFLVLGCMLILVIAYFLLFIPLTYYLPLTKQAFLRISVFSWNGLKPI